MKRNVYLFCFTILGGMVGFLLHGVLEIWYINRLVLNYETFGLGLNFATWFVIHEYFAAGMLVLGLVWGYFQGKKWWRVLYVERKYGKFFKRPLKQNF